MKNNEQITEKSEKVIEYTYSSNIVDVFKKTRMTILLSTYQSNKIMIMGQHNNAFDIRYKEFQRPMGMYAKNGRIWVGLGHGIYQFANFSSLATTLGDDKAFDACYMPQSIHYTGNVDIHEMEHTQDELYFVNTYFSCLCIKDSNSSFKPVWKPPFISFLQPLDKCHLNGFCTRDGEPRYVTALGKSDEPLGWRANKVNGGILMDIKTNEMLADGLSMPHSPRWHQGKLWLLESGKGALSYFDFEKKRVVEVIQLPGFTRGLTMAGNLAFIGLSKVRESATFSGLPITKLPKRFSGVWIVDLKTAEIVSFIEFTAGIDEVFAVSILPHRKVEMFDFDSDQSKDNYLIAPEDFAAIKLPETRLEFAAPHFQKGSELFNENRKKEAIEEYKKALAIQSDYLPATLGMAVALGDLGHYEEAETMLKGVMEEDASIIGAYQSLGYVYYKKGEFETAKEQFQKILELDSTNTRAKNSLYIVQKEMGEI